MNSLAALRNDELFLLALELPLPDLLNFCSTSKNIDSNICLNDKFWQYKLNREFPNWNTAETSDYKDPISLESLKYIETFKERYLLFYRLRIFEIIIKELKLTTNIYYLYQSRRIVSENHKSERIPKEIGILINLVILDLFNNNIQEIPKEMEKLTNLRELYLGHNKLEEISISITNLTNLEILEINNNFITVIPKEIGKLIHLKQLYLAGSENHKITEIPKEIGDLVNLEILDLYDNLINKIPEEIGNLTLLQQLNLSSNKIKEIPTSIINLKKLKLLDLTNTMITQIPKDIQVFLGELNVEFYT